MPILNTTRDTVLAQHFLECRSLLSKSRGLMFRHRPVPLVMVFDRDWPVSLHMWFVFFPIDVVYLDDRRRVQAIKERFRPFTTAGPVYCRFIIELPVGTIKNTKTQLGDRIRF